MRLCGDPDEAKELVQDVFVKAFRQLATFRGDSAFSSWLHTILVRTELNSRRARQRRSCDISIDAVQDIPADIGSRIELDMRDRLYEAIDELPAIYRITFIMHDIEGYTHGEIGEASGVAEGTSRARLSEARSRLRTALQPFFTEQ